ncbi:AmmeMemoRadiSam system protein B [bacterium]|nr:AmmeMemoRadiSam system protein B [bacterium]MBU1995052.1 AmmeMemoRadiSam system protein B [bacterium]
MIREMSVSGSFYPQRSKDLYRYFEHFNEIYDENFKLATIKSKAVIVPHAGYVYSGYTANVAYRILEQNTIKNFVVIGPSHKVAFEGVSMCNFTSYETPIGDIAAADKVRKELQKTFKLSCLKHVHAEHSTEVQFPFIKHYLEDANIIELVYGHIKPAVLSEIINFILQKEDCGVIISTDLSHFYTLDEANDLDNICLNSINKLDVSLIHKGCEACGKIGVEAMLMSAKKLNLTPTILDYRTSADASKDTSRVVGYVSVCFS